MKRYGNTFWVQDYYSLRYHLDLRNALLKHEIKDICMYILLLYNIKPLNTDAMVDLFIYNHESASGI